MFLNKRKKKIIIIFHCYNETNILLLDSSAKLLGKLANKSTKNIKN